VPMVDEQRNVIVTGGSRGLGLGIAKTLAQAGYHVIVLARRESPELAEAIESAAANGAGAIDFTAFDLERIDDIPGVVQSLRKNFGPIHGLVNNAAIGTEGVLATMHNSQIEALVRLNTISPIVLTKYVVRMMMSSGSGRIVNIASIIGFTGYSSLSVYAATKASMIGFTRSLAREVGRLGITVNAVAPGFVDTDMTRGLDEEHRVAIARRSALRRLPEAEDVGNAVEFLMSDRARNITGTVLTVDAGNTA
jgi:3-oxoacyl-[acyl-carrier protein] reductase